MANQRSTRGFWTPEFVLVCVMLFVLVALVLIVLRVPIGPVQGADANGASTREAPTFAEMADYRKSMLNVIVTVFGAWVGAGAAYFFGRENLKEAADSLLAMRQPSAREQLYETLVREIPPKILDWRVKVSDSLQPVVEKLEQNPTYWFITVVKEDGTLETVLEAHGLWRFINKQLRPEEGEDKSLKEARVEVLNEKVSEVLNAPEVDAFKDRHVTAKLDESAGKVHEQMAKERVTVALIVDEKGKPTHFFTTADVKNLLLQTG